MSGSIDRSIRKFKHGSVVNMLQLCLMTWGLTGKPCKRRQHHQDLKNSDLKMPRITMLHQQQLMAQLMAQLMGHCVPSSLIVCLDDRLNVIMPQSNEFLSSINRHFAVFELQTRTQRWLTLPTNKARDKCIEAQSSNQRALLSVIGVYL